MPLGEAVEACRMHACFPERKEQAVLQNRILETSAVSEESQICSRISMIYSPVVYSEHTGYKGGS